MLHPGCRMAVNIGDQYLRASEHGRYSVQPIPADLSVLGRRIGFDFLGNLIWRKLSTTHTSGGGQWMGSTYYPRNGHITYEHEYIVVLRKRGTAPRPSKRAREKSRLTKQQRSAWFRGVWDDISPERQNGHVAMFPGRSCRGGDQDVSFWGEMVLESLSWARHDLARRRPRRARNSVGYESQCRFRADYRGGNWPRASTHLANAEATVGTAASSVGSGIAHVENLHGGGVS